MPDHSELIRERQQLDDGLMIRTEGEIDLIRSPQLRAELLQVLDSGIDRLVIDLEHVPFMDSSGVATLVEALQVQRKKGKKLVLCNLQQKVRSIFEISRLDMVFTIADDAEAAARA